MHETQPHLHPLTSPQREIWFDQILHEGIPLYNIGGYVKIPGVIDPVLFEKAINLLVQKHDNLRTMLSEVAGEDGVPMQTYAEKLAVTVPMRDFSDEEHPHEAAMAWMQQQFVETFELTGQPLFRYDLVKISEDCYYWLLQYHHLIVDGYGVAMFNRSLAEIYTQLANEQVPNLDSPSYLNFIEDDRAYVESAVFDKQRQYWLDKYPTPPEPLFNPRYRSHYTNKLIGSGCEVLYLPRDFYSHLNELAKQHNATLFHLFLGALYVYFTRTAQRDDFAIGLPVLNRANANFKKTAGLFTGVSPTLFNFGKDLSFAELLRKINKTLKANYRHQRFPVSEINREVGLGPERSQLFDINLSYENHDYDAQFGTIDSYFTAMLHPWEQTPLMIFVRDFHAQAKVKFDFVFNQAYFNINEIKALQARFVTILEAVLKDSVSPIHTLPIMTEQESKQLQAWNYTTTDYPKDKTIVDLFEQQVQQTPDNIAVVFEEQQLTYQQLNEKANQLAHYLLNLKTFHFSLFTSNFLVAIAMERSLEMVIGLLGILKAGGAYVPIDPSYPAARIDYMLQDSAAPLLVTQSHLKAQLFSVKPNCVTVCLDEVNFAIQPLVNPLVTRQATDLAYVIYTSGSTGKPKGCKVTQFNVVRLFAATDTCYQFNQQDVWTLFHSYAFDFSVWEIWGALLYGGKLVVVPYFTTRTPADFYQLLIEQNVTVLNQTPSAFGQLINVDNKPDKLFLRLVIFGGEALDFTQLQPWFASHGDECPQLVNMYGITETTVHVTYCPLTNEPNQSKSLIGIPLPDLQVWVVDTNHQPVPIGIPGEMYVGGAGVTNGYLNRPELTKEKFVEVELFGKTERIYKTGDLARWLPDGNLEYIGRIDSQVKLRGFRIELGEIEAVLQQHPAIKESVVITWAENEMEKRLVAYLLPVVQSELPKIHELPAFLKKFLPDYMVPAAFVVIEQIPLNANGKIDYRALPSPSEDGLVDTQTLVAPNTPEEHLLAEIWQEVLKVGPIGIHNNFFAVGGDSILSIRIIAKAKQAGYTLAVKDLFLHPTIAQLAQVLSVQETQIEPQIISVPFSFISETEKALLSADVEDAYPLAALQAGMLFHSQYETESAIYHDVFSYYLQARYDESLLQIVIQNISELHPVLRTSFHFQGYREPLQFVHRNVQVPFSVSDIRYLSVVEQEAEIDDFIAIEKQDAFDWEFAPLFRVKVHRRQESAFNLTLSFHHAILDGWSVASLMTELLRTYLYGIEQGQVPAIRQSSPNLHYRDFIALEREAITNEATQVFWQQQLEEITLTRLSRLPKAHRAASTGNQYEVVISASLSNAIKKLAKRLEVPVKTVLLTAHLRVISLFSGVTDVITGLVTNGRHESENGEKIAGLFLNTIPFRLQLQPNESWTQLIQATFQKEQAVLPHRRYPLIEMQKAFQGQPLFETAFNFTHFHVYQGILETDTVKILGFKGFEQTNFALTGNFSLDLITGDVQMSLSYNPDELGLNQIKNMALYYLQVLTMMTEQPVAFSNVCLLPTEIEQLKVWNDTATDYPKDKTIVDLFEQQVSITPDNIAVVFEEQQLTYQQLNDKANQLAHYLLNLKTFHFSLFTSNFLVAIAMERSFEMIIGLLGILKAGGAYVPIDPSYPAARIDYMLQDSAAPLLLTQSHLKAQLFSVKPNCVTVCLDEVNFAGQPLVNPLVTRQVSDLAYVIYTSGSTGKPKGVMLEHYGAVNLAIFQQQYFCINANSHILQFASLSFDAATWEILMSLCNGGKLQLALMDIIHTDLKAILQKQTITHATLPPSVINVISNSDLPELKYLVVAGEACLSELVMKWAQSGWRFINAYGPTEVTVCTSVFECTPDGNKPPIGQPIANTRIYILDAQRQSLPPGIPGELCIAGVGLARGYLNRPELTAEKFIEVELFGKTERIYKTGDKARWLPDGNLEYLGRIDHQVKLRGFRIELGEIEAVLSQHEAVKEAVVTLFDSDDNKRLVAYITTDSEANNLKVLSFAQQRLWFLNQFEENNSATYNMPAALQLSGHLEVEALQHSLDWLLERHASLRTLFPIQSGQALVQIQPLSEIEVLTIHDLTKLSSQREEVQNRANHHAVEPFDLSQGHLFKADLLLLNEQQSVLLLNMHHIISDGWSMGVFIRDWQHAYTAFAQGEQPSKPPLLIQYSDYAAWQRDWLQGSVLQQQVDYWQQQLQGIPELLELPTDKPRPPQQSYQGAHYAQRLSPTLTRSITTLSRQQGVSLFMTLLTTFNILLSRYSRQDDVCVGSPIANRTHSQTEDLIGFFVNTLVLRGQPRPEQSFIDLLLQTRQICLAAYAHQDIPFETLVEQLQPTRSLSYSPLFQVMLVLQNNDPVELTLPGLEITALEADYPIAKFDLTLNVEEQEGQLHCLWEYATDLFYAETIKRMASHFETLLGAIVDNPTQSISQLSMLTEAEKEQLLAWNDTTTDYPKDKTIVDLFEQQVQRTPDNIAVVFEEQQLTYQQLNEKANQLAHYLLNLKTFHFSLLTSNFLVAITVERSLEMVIGLLGILKAGGAYVPIDPSYPAARVQYMLEDCAAPLLVTQSHLKAQLFSVKPNCVTVCLDEVNFADQPLVNPLVTRQVTDLAYVIYTSGSTGKPKGTLLTHKGLSNYLHWAVQCYAVTNGNGAPVQSSIAFDATITSLYLPLIAGKATVLLPEHEEIEGLVTILQQGPQFSLVKITPAHLEILNHQLSHANYVDNCHVLVLGGETLTSVHINRWLRYAPDTHLINEYGPTEAVVGCCIYDAKGQITLNGPIPIGQPIANTRIYILDAQRQSLPPGIPGELCIAGAGLARGYLNRPELTAEKFIEVELFGKTERIYKTGDLARWLPDGNLEYLGRIDHQVKLRGFRIELGEIEAVLSQHKAVKETVVTLFDSDDNKRLVAYVVEVKSEKTGNSLVTELKEWLKVRLPDYMVPSCFTVLDKLPLTPNGKIDRKALPAPEIEIFTGAKPATPTEDLLANLWAAVLKCEVINRHDNFFELGGHSLLATQLIARIRDSFQVELPVRAVFEHPQLSSLAKAIETATGTINLPAIEIQPEDSPKILSFAQQRLWFLNQFEDSATYNMPAALLLSGELNLAALQQSLYWLQERHASLRTYFPMDAGKATIQIQTIDKIEALRVHDLRLLTDEVQSRANSHAIAPFDLATGPLFKAELLQLNETQSVLLLNMHHIISDGWSMGVFIRDWQHAYTAFTQGEQPSKPPLLIQYSDYAAWQRDWLQGEVLQEQIDYWVKQLADAPQTLNLPTDKPRPEQLSYRGADFTFRIDEDLTQTLKAFSQQQNCTLFMTLMAVYAVLLSRYSGQKDLLIATPIAGRLHYQLENLIGFFVNNLIIRVKPDNTLNFTGLLAEVRKTLLEAYAHQDLPFEKLIEALNIPRRQNYPPLSQVAFTLNNIDTTELQLPGLEIEPLPISFNVAKTDLTLALTENAGQLQGSVNYSTALFTDALIRQFANDFQNLLKLLLEQSQQPLRQVLKNSGIQSRNSTLAGDMAWLTEHSNLTPNQLLIWLGQQAKPEEAALYQNPLFCHLPFAVSYQHFQNALDTLIRSSDALRVVFHETSGVPRQQVLPELVYQVEWVDFSDQPDPKEALQIWAMKRNAQIFSLSERVFNVVLIKLAPAHFVFCLNIHQLIGDGVAIDLIISHLSHFYRQSEAGKLPVKVELPQFQKYLDDTETYLDSSRYQQDETYWQQHAQTAPLSFYGKTSRQGSGRVHCVRYDLSMTEMQRLHLCVGQLADTQQVNHTHLMHLFNTMLVVYLHKISHSTEIVIGIPLHNRRTRAFKQTIGSFMQVLPMPISVGADDSFVSLYHKIKQVHQPLLRHGRYALRNPSQNPLYEAVLNYHIARYDKFAGHPVKTDWQRATFSSDLLTLNIHDFAQSGQLRLEFDLNTEVFDEANSHDVIEHFHRVLSAMLDNPEQPLTTVSLLTPAAQQQLIQWNQTKTNYPKDQTIVDLFEQQVEKVPDNIAVVFKDQQLTYQQLNDKANQLAHYLLSIKTQEGTILIQNNLLIAISVERSFSMIIGLLAILKSGGAYVPIDPSYPQARIRYMLGDSACPLLLTQSHLKAQLESDCVVLCLDEVDFSDQSSENPAIRFQMDELAYVIYTSGSTGKPKGVMIEHSALSNFIHSSINVYALTSHDKVLQFASVSFDTAAEEIYPTLLKGAALILRTEEILSTTEAFLTTCDEQKLTVLDLPTAYWHSLLTDMQIIKKYWPKSIRLVLIGGEAVSGERIKQWLENFGHFPALLNTYGPTETTVVATVFPFDTPTINKILTVSIGQPIANTRIYILDAQHQSLPPGIPGELCIAGAGLARGYLNRPELTAEKFIEVELFGKTERIYKTGDLARWLPDGNLEYLGRIDHQVKLRGFRIELGEIEAVLSQHEAVKEAVVTLFDSDDNKRLVAYLKVKSEKLKVKSEETEEVKDPLFTFHFSLFTELKDWLKARLPDYMIPSHFTVLDKLPLTPNGKIDRKALPAPDSNTPTENTLPRDAIELQLLGVWEIVLDVHPLGIHDNFFEKGGHSLLAVKLMSHIQQQFRKRLPVNALFQSPTVATLAQQLCQDITPLLTNLVPIQTKGEANPVYCLPGAIGSVMYLYPLASYLGQQQPFYALQTPGLDGSTTPETVEKLASFHLQALRQQQPNGPYQLMGHSSGGRVAFEMAWQLEQQGETVAFLAILDTSAPNDSNQPNPMADYTEVNWLSDIVLVFEELSGVDLNCSLKDLRGFQNLAGLPDLETAYVQVMQAFVERQVLFAPGAVVDELKALVNTYRITVQGHADYQIPGKLRCPIHLFRASEQTPNVENVEFEETREAWGWAECTHAKVEEIMIPGTHITMMALPHVKVLADKLSQNLLQNHA